MLFFYRPVIVMKNTQYYVSLAPTATGGQGHSEASLERTGP